MSAPKPRVLLFCDWYYPGFKAGGPIQSCTNLVKALAGEYQFFVFTSDRDLGDESPYAVPVNQWVPGAFGEEIYYRSPGRLGRNEFKAILDYVQPELLYFNSMFSIHYTILPLIYLGKRMGRYKLVLAPRGMLQQGAMQLKAGKKRIFLFLFRRLGWDRMIRFQATDQQELADIKSWFPRAELMLAENIPNRLESKPVAPLKEKGRARLVFISRVHPKKNLHYLLELLGSVDHGGTLELDIYGVADEPDYERRCRELAGGMRDNVQVRFMGPVNNRLVFDTLRSYHFFVLPTLGENFGHAIFEALTSGKPVLLSDQTPWRGLEQIRAGWDIPLSDREAFLGALETIILMDDNEYGYWSQGAFDLAAAYLAQAGYEDKYKKLFS
jgi:glycosyltransferase involved in cell wall biosynthesis